MTAEFDIMGHEVPIVDLDAMEELALTAAGRSWALPTCAVEVGTWAGQGARRIVKAGCFPLFCVDHWEGGGEWWFREYAERYPPRVAFQTFCRNMGDRFLRTVFPCVGRSATWAATWNRPINFLFIDASHDYESCFEDIVIWKKHVVRGGIVAVHDYMIFGGVTRAVDELLPGRKIAGATIAYQEVE